MSAVAWACEGLSRWAPYARTAWRQWWRRERRRRGCPPIHLERRPELVDSESSDAAGRARVERGRESATFLGRCPTRLVKNMSKECCQYVLWGRWVVLVSWATAGCDGASWTRLGARRQSRGFRLCGVGGCGGVRDVRVSGSCLALVFRPIHPCPLSVCCLLSFVLFILFIFH